MKIAGTYLFWLAVMSGCFGQAQNTKETLQDRNQIAWGKQALDRDKAELETFSTTVTRFNKAVQNNDLEQKSNLKAELLAGMQREISQTEIKIKKAKVEEVQGAKELGTDRREKRRNRRTFSGSKDDKKDMARDRRNIRDDRRDIRDDKSDTNELQVRLQNQNTLYQNFKMTGIDAEEASNTAILDQFITSMKADISETQGELVEDRGEAREDRRERRDDRRERREKY